MQEASREDQLEKPTVKISHYEVCSGHRRLDGRNRTCYMIVDVYLPSTSEDLQLSAASPEARISFTACHILQAVHENVACVCDAAHGCPMTFMTQLLVTADLSGEGARPAGQCAARWAWAQALRAAAHAQRPGRRQGPCYCGRPHRGARLWLLPSACMSPVSLQAQQELVGELCHHWLLPLLRQKQRNIPWIVPRHLVFQG